jgi:N-acetylglucosamine malate deacetylase 2
MRDRDITELTRRTLVIVAHPDDESVGAGALMQRTKEARLIFCTDGGPRDPYFWKRYGSRENYVRVRREEAEAAAKIIGIKAPLSLSIIDQELYRNLRPALDQLGKLVRSLHPNAILTHAYEGGHPDHDSCAFLSYILGQQHALSVWEMPLYHRTGEGPRHQEFVKADDGEWIDLRVEDYELHKKESMVRAYASQTGILEAFDLRIERFRPQPKYDFRRPPQSEVINYEAWQWPMRAVDLCAEFAAVCDEIAAGAPARRRS